MRAREMDLKSGTPSGRCLDRTLGLIDKILESLATGTNSKDTVTPLLASTLTGLLKTTAHMTVATRQAKPSHRLSIW